MEGVTGLNLLNTPELAGSMRDIVLLFSCLKGLLVVKRAQDLLIVVRLIAFMQCEA